MSWFNKAGVFVGTIVLLSFVQDRLHFKPNFRFISELEHVNYRQRHTNIVINNTTRSYVDIKNSCTTRWHVNVEKMLMVVGYDGGCLTGVHCIPWLMIKFPMKTVIVVEHNIWCSSNGYNILRWYRLFSGCSRNERIHKLRTVIAAGILNMVIKFDETQFTLTTNRHLLPTLTRELLASWNIFRCKDIFTKLCKFLILLVEIEAKQI